MTINLGDYPGSPALTHKTEYRPPSQTLGVLAIMIFFAEMVSMAVLYFLKIPDYAAMALFDGLIMVILILPALYYLHLKPLIKHIEYRDQAETALRASESLFRKVLETLPVGVWIVDEHGKIIHANPACYEIWGGARFVGIDQYNEYKAWWPETGQQIQTEEWAATRAITKGEITLDEEVAIESFDGKHKFILNSALPIVDEQEKVRGAIIVNHDVTESKQAQQAVMQTNELLEKFFSSISTSIAYMDRDFNFIRVNETYARSAGYPPDFFIGKNHFEMYPHEENQRIFQRVVETGEPYSVLEKPFEYPDFPERGVTYWDWGLQPVKAASGWVEGVVLSLIDVSERKRSEIQLEHQNEELRLITDAERRQRELAEGLVNATITVNSSLQLDQVLCSILEQIRQRIPFSGAGILLIEGMSMRVGSILGFEDLPQDLPAMPEKMMLADYPILQQICSTQQPVLVEHASDHPGWRQFSGMEWIRSYLAAPLMIDGIVVGIINLLSDIPAAFTHEEVDQLFAFTAPAAAALRNARLFKAESRARQVAETLSVAAKELTQTLDLEHVFDTLLDYIHRAVPSDTAGITLLTDETHMAVRAWRGYGRFADREDIHPISVTGGADTLLHHLNSERRSLLIQNSPDFQGNGDLAGSQEIHAILAVPIIASDKVIGLVELGSSDQEPYLPEQIEWIEALVSQAGVAIQNAWLFEQVSSSSDRLQALARKLVEIQENERTTIARELHDVSGQALSSLKLSLGKLESDPDCPDRFHQRLLELKGHTDNILEDLHRLAMYLRPVALDRLGLLAAVEQLAHNMDTAWLPIRFKAVGFDSKRLPRDIESALYRIVQEALTNIVRHAHASTIGILLERNDQRVKVFVEDDGIGFDPDELNEQDRLGMVGMHERAEMFGGILTIESSPGKGTSIIVEVPVGDTDSDR